MAMVSPISQLGKLKFGWSNHAVSWRQGQDGDPALGFSTKSSSITRPLQVALDLRVPLGSRKCSEGFTQGRLGVRSGRHMETGGPRRRGGCPNLEYASTLQRVLLGVSALTEKPYPPPSLWENGAALPKQSVPELSRQKLSRQRDFIGPINPCQSDSGTPNKGLYLEAVIIWLPGEKPQLSFHRYFLSKEALSRPLQPGILF